MIDENTIKSILKDISLTGAVSEESAVVKPIIGGNLIHVLNLSSGLPRIHNNVAKRFNLILSQPELLSILNPFEIRCCLCKQVIRYPAWYYSVKYAINQFHYFVCFDSKSPDKVNAACYRKTR